MRVSVAKVVYFQVLGSKTKVNKKYKNPLFWMHMMAQISFFFLLQTVEDGDNEETPVQEPQPED